MAGKPGRSGRPKGSTTAAAYQGCERIYAAMLDQAEPLAVASWETRAELGPLLRRAGVGNDAERVAELFPAAAIFRGNLIPLMRGLGMRSLQTYDQRKRELVKMGCIRQLRAGRRHVTGCWILLQPPTPALWDAKVRPPREASPEARVRGQHDQAIVAFLVNFRARYPALWREVMAAGIRDTRGVLGYLARQPEARLRALFPAGECCIAYRVPGPRTSAGCPAWMAPSRTGSPSGGRSGRAPANDYPVDMLRGRSAGTAGRSIARAARLASACPRPECRRRAGPENRH